MKHHGFLCNLKNNAASPVLTSLLIIMATCLGHAGRYSSPASRLPDIGPTLPTQKKSHATRQEPGCKRLGMAHVLEVVQRRWALPVGWTVLAQLRLRDLAHADKSRAVLLGNFEPQKVCTHVSPVPNPTMELRGLHGAKSSSLRKGPGCFGQQRLVAGFWAFRHLCTRQLISKGRRTMNAAVSASSLAKRW